MDERCDGRTVRPSPWRARRAAAAIDRDPEDLDFGAALGGQGAREPAPAPDNGADAAPPPLPWGNIEAMDELPVPESDVCVAGEAEEWDPEQGLRETLEEVGDDGLAGDLLGIFRASETLPDIDARAEQAQADHRRAEDATVAPPVKPAEGVVESLGLADYTALHPHCVVRNESCLLR